jgi:hypothetical protein
MAAICNQGRSQGCSEQALPGVLCSSSLQKHSGHLECAANNTRHPEKQAAAPHVNCLGKGAAWLKVPETRQELSSAQLRGSLQALYGHNRAKVSAHQDSLPQCDCLGPNLHPAQHGRKALLQQTNGCQYYGNVTAAMATTP